MTELTTILPKAQQLWPSRALGLARSSPVGWLRDEFDRLLDEIAVPLRTVSGATMDVVPAMEMHEEDKAYRLTAELPGMAVADIDISVADGKLRISGEKKEATESKKNGTMISERRYGAFERRVSLPADADAKGIKASFKDGILTVSIKKDEKAASSTQKIAIEAA